jgi:hypothetical protein
MRWFLLIQKLGLKLITEKTTDMAVTHEKERERMAREHHRDFVKQEDDHLKRVFREREQHVELYNIKPMYDNALEKIKQQSETIVFQREELNAMLKRLAKYAKREMSSYPQGLLKRGYIDLDIWQLTREAQSDEDKIQSLQKLLLETLTQFQQFLSW